MPDDRRKKKKTFKQTNKSKTGAPLSSTEIKDYTTVAKFLSPGSPGSS